MGVSGGMQSFSVLFCPTPWETVLDICHWKHVVIGDVNANTVGQWFSTPTMEFDRSYLELASFTVVRKPPKCLFFKIYIKSL